MLSGVFFLALLAGIILAVVLFVRAIASYPAQAEKLYGPPSSRLSTFQRFSLSYQLVRDRSVLLEPTDPNWPEVVFSITIDEATASILNRLEASGLVPDEDALRNYLVYTGLDTQLQAGDFFVSPAMTPVDIVHAMLDPTPRYVTVVILPGWRIEQIAESIPTTGLSISPGEFLTAAQKRPTYAPINEILPFGLSLEGFFLPGSYEVLRDSSAVNLVDIVLAQFDAQVSLDLREGFARQGLSLYQAVTLASIVEREAVIPEEMPLIASVFLNRLAIDMKLETDPTVQYALGYNAAQGTWWTNPLSLFDLEYDSPYNTYLYTGLPPGPISNPSMAALQAVAFPGETPYYYFRAACDGSGRHNFAQTFEEHIANACP